MTLGMPMSAGVPFVQIEISQLLAGLHFGDPSTFPTGLTGPNITLTNILFIANSKC